MSKKGKNSDDKDFFEFKKQLPAKYRDMLEMLGVSSYEDLLGLSVMMGIDPDKLQKYSDEHGEDAIPSMDEVMFDEDDPALGFSQMMKGLQNTDGGDGDPFMLPEKIFFDNEHSLVYHLRVKLNNSPVPVWRELEVPSNISLEFFAFVLIIAMGWDNTHLHQFKVKNAIYKNSVCYKHDNEMFGCPFGCTEVYVANDYPVSALFKEKGDRVQLEYDFGDSWMHDVWLKGVREYGVDESPCLKVLKGKGACPPEDCGGVGGYDYLLEILDKKRKSAEEKERLAWHGIDKYFDPEYFDDEWAQDELDSLWDDALF